MARLEELPTEILWQVMSNIETARDLSYLSLVCKKLHRCVEKNGFRIFAKNVFPSIQIPAPVQYGDDPGSFWRDACWSMTTLSRNWDRKALLAHRELPTQASPQHWRGHRLHQTIGFAPVIDAYEDWYGGDWRDRYQVLACGAGPQLYVRVTDLGKDSHRSHHHQQQNRSEWSAFGHKGLKDGIDDITSLKLLPPFSANEQKLVIGRSNGSIEGIVYNHDRRTFDSCQYFKTTMDINCMSLNGEGLLAMNHQFTEIATYNSNEFSFISDGSKRFSDKRGSRARRMEFVNRSTLIICGTQGIDRLITYDVEKNVTRDINTRIGAPVYSLAILGDSSTKYGNSNLFLSGGFDGVVRLHDLRCQNTDVLHFDDRIDSSAVYSLVAWGKERFVAGGASHSLLKFFDIRLPGMKKYYATNLRQFEPPSSVREASTCPILRMRKGWNVFISRDGSTTSRSSSFRERDSPVYSLTKSSEFSPSFFAGTESTLYQLDMVSMMDKHPDPIFGVVPDTGSRDRDIKAMWGNRYKKPILRLPMYEHPSTTHESVQLQKQRPVGFYPPNRAGCDERWESTY